MHWESVCQEEAAGVGTWGISAAQTTAQQSNLNWHQPAPTAPGTTNQNGVREKGQDGHENRNEQIAMKQLPALAVSLAASLTLFTAAMDPILATELGLHPAGDPTLGRTWSTAGTPTGTIMATTAAKTTAISTTSSLNNGETAIPMITTIESQLHGRAR